MISDLQIASRKATTTWSPIPVVAIVIFLKSPEIIEMGLGSNWLLFKFPFPNETALITLSSN